MSLLDSPTCAGCIVAISGLAAAIVAQGAVQGGGNAPGQWFIPANMALRHIYRRINAILGATGPDLGLGANGDCHAGAAGGGDTDFAHFCSLLCCAGYRRRGDSMLLPVYTLPLYIQVASGFAKKN